MALQLRLAAATVVAALALAGACNGDLGARSESSSGDSDGGDASGGGGGMVGRFAHRGFQGFVAAVVRRQLLGRRFADLADAERIDEAV